MLSRAVRPHLLCVLNRSQPRGAHEQKNKQTKLEVRSAAHSDSGDETQVSWSLIKKKQWWVCVRTVIMQITAVGGTEQNVFTQASYKHKH